jgi:hypothetical protein
MGEFLARRQVRVCGAALKAMNGGHQDRLLRFQLRQGAYEWPRHAAALKNEGLWRFVGA